MFFRPLIIALYLPLCLAAAGCASKTIPISPINTAKKEAINVPEPTKIKSEPINADTLERIAHRSLKEGKYETAAIFYSRALEMDSKRVSAQRGLADSLIEIGNYPQAGGLYRRLLATYPNDPQIRHNLGRSLIATKQEKEGLWYIQRLIAKNPTADLINDAGVAEHLLGHTQKAQDDFRQAQALMPGDTNSRNNLGVSLALTGEYAKAERILYDLARQPRSLPAVRSNLAIVTALAHNRPTKRNQLIFLAMRHPSGSVPLASAIIAQRNSFAQNPTQSSERPRIAQMFPRRGSTPAAPYSNNHGQLNQNLKSERIQTAETADTLSSSGLPPKPPSVSQAAPGPGGFVTSYASTNKAAKPATMQNSRSKPAETARRMSRIAMNSPPRSGPYIVQLGAFEDKGNAEAAMQGMTLKAPRIISKNPLTVEANKSRSMGLMYRVRTMQGTDRGSADALCAELKTRRLRCFVGIVR